MPARDARTTIETDSEGHGVPIAPPAPTEALKDNEVRLSDGRVVALRETNALDDERVLEQLRRAGYQLQDLAMLSLGRYSALFAIESIDGDPFEPPKGKVQIELFLKNMKTADALRLVRKYSEVNGLEDEETFR